MSDTDLNEFETVDDNAEPGKLRQLLKQAHATLKQKDEELATLRTAETQRSVKATWDELKVPDVIRKLYNAEDKSSEAIKNWWNEYREVFNIQVAEEAPAEQEPTPEELAQQAAAQQFQEASTLGTNAIHSGFDAVKTAGTAAKEAFLKGGSRADYDAALAAAYEGLNTPKF